MKVRAGSACNDMLPEPTEIQREIDIRVADAAAGTIEMFDVATGTSLYKGR